MKKTAARPIKPAKGIVPAMYADGGKVAPFKGKQSKAEEMAEAKAVKSGKVSPMGYAAKEMAEEKKAGVKKPNKAALVAKGKALASGKMTPAQYAAAAKKGK